MTSKWYQKKVGENEGLLSMVTENKRKRIGELNKQLFQAGIIGLLKGSLIGLISGIFINYKYNCGPNQRLFRTPLKVAYLVGWSFVGIIFCTDIEKLKMSKQLAMEEQIKHNMFVENEIINSRK